MADILYVDRPFAGETGGDKNRSRFLWKAVAGNFKADLLLFSNSTNHSEMGWKHNARTRTLVVPYHRKGGFSSENLYSIRRDAVANAKEFIKTGGYKTIVIRMFTVADILRFIDTDQVEVIIDVDMMLSRLAQLAWRSNRSVSNRYYLMETIKHNIYERKMFRKNYKFLFTNSVEMEDLKKVSGYSEESGKFHLMPNVMQIPEGKPEAKKVNRKLLFYGMLDSIANSDGFHYFMDDIYPLIEETLEKCGGMISIAGRNMPESFRDSVNGKRVELLGEVDDLGSLIASSLGVILPLRVATGTRTRIAETAVFKRPVVTTNIGAEGMIFDKNSIIIEDMPVKFAEGIISLLDNIDEAGNMGKRLYDSVYSRYSEAAIENSLRGLIDNSLERRM